MIKRFRDFWERDIINKLIMLVSLLLAGVVFAFIYLLANLPGEKSLIDAVSMILPKPSRTSADPLVYTPEWTTTPLVFKSTPTFLPTIAPSLPTIQTLDTATPVLALTALTPSTGMVLSTLTQQITPEVFVNKSCIPNNPAQIGRVVEVIDGSTIKVLIDGLVYVVRYIGVESPEDEYIGRAARQLNSVLVYGKDVSLIADVSNKDENGRLLRYVVAGDTFVNLEMIFQKLGTAVDIPPDSACAQIFNQAEQ
ncbi:thermonuclease family protein [Candidatus Villigracilis saccharophilus]|uniref:thermonuclease family protein n=1 Tax=Candidatus Villigracilis saccharophilus TaxID=3140684 RepID=UPI0031358849|nr:thermonuclease family protein [Anaerolineales bacterium]